ncbi:Uncharacterised protein [Mycobacterium tuberculosis]|uniref:Uncharacterized protein n=1 Tax=Mycobacterium tuberculosis TaxID=1773 RepID=A0A916LFZ3_MYCTX|nr:Uncharacterised protein [Mycobacterium tuberculosis]CPB00698.1 Uncharacterised protein [Mycobacterium tuberculosis]
MTKTSTPHWRASCTAAMPTPPVPAWISTDSPALISAKSANPYQAVKNTTGTAAA